MTTDQFHIDILCAHFVQHPDWFDVVVGSNLFGDILSDLGPAVAGSIGIAASANINPEKAFPQHVRAGAWLGARISRASGSPIRSARSGPGAMMLEHLGEKAAADAIVSSIEKMLGEGGPRTRDMGGQAGTVDVGKALAEAVGRA